MKYSLRVLTVKDSLQVDLLDEMSGNYVGQWLEDNTDYAWGLFNKKELVGYCTIGYADDCRKEIMTFPGWTDNSLLLSDVFIKPEYRHQGLGQKMINEAIVSRTTNEKELVFLTLLYDGLSEFYKKIGFNFIKEGVMVRDERVQIVSANQSMLDTKIQNALNRTFENQAMYLGTPKEIER